MTPWGQVDGVDLPQHPTRGIGSWITVIGESTSEAHEEER
jgi:hypothetical protein